MADDTAQAATQTDQASADATTHTTQTATDTTQQAAQAAAQRDPAAVEAELKEARKEAAQYRTKLREAETKLGTIEQAQMTDADKAAARLKELEGMVAQQADALRLASLRSEVTRQARALNIVDDDAALKLLDTAAIEYAEDGKPKNVAALLQALVKEKPYLIGVTSNTSAANPGATDPVAHEQAVRQMVYGSQAVPLNPATAAQHGGGVLLGPQ
jgi:hypothetical protein